MSKKTFILLFILMCSIFSSAQINNSFNQLFVNLYPIKVDGKWGYINKSGIQKISPKYNRAFPFYEGMAMVMADEDFLFINNTGDTLFNAGGRAVNPMIKNGMIRFKENELIGYLDKSGTVKIDAQYPIAGDFQERLSKFLCPKIERTGFIDKTGKTVIDAQFHAAGDFQNGFAPVRLNNKWAYISAYGKLLSPFKYTMAQNFSENMAATWVYGTHLVYINLSGEKIFSHQIYTAGNLPTGNWKLPAFPCKGGMIKIKDAKSGLFGFVNKKGEIVIACKYEACNNFSDGLASFKSGDKWGYMNRRGKVIIRAQYDNAEDFTNGLAAVLSNGSIDDFRENKENVKMGYINKSGKIIWNYSN